MQISTNVNQCLIMPDPPSIVSLEYGIILRPWKLPERYKNNNKQFEVIKTDLKFKKKYLSGNFFLYICSFVGSKSKLLTICIKIYRLQMISATEIDGDGKLNLVYDINCP